MDRRSAIAKVKKLLNRARANPGHEADTALALAQELIKRFDLFEVEVDTQAPTNALLEEKAELWKELLSFAVAHSLGCRIFKKTTGELWISGSPSASDLAVSLYRALRDYALGSCGRKVPINFPAHDNIAFVATLLDKMWMSRFLYGFARTVSERLSTKAAAPAPQPPTEAAPRVVVTPQAAPGDAPRAGVEDPAENAPEEHVADEPDAEDDYEDEEDEPSPDLGDETSEEQAEQISDDMLAQGLALVKQFSRGWSFHYAADYAGGLYDLAFNHGKAAGAVVDLDTYAFVPRRQIA